MAASAPYAIPVIANAVRQIQPQSILDVGVGFGKYGVLFREYVDVWSAKNADETKRGGWRMRLEGIEVFPDYLSPLHDYIYDHIHIGQAESVIDSLGQYDVIFMGDVLEHFTKEDGQRMIQKLYEHATKCVLLTYPRDAQKRDGILENPAEAHLSTWSDEDFKPFPRFAYTVLENRADVCALAKPPFDPPFLVGCFAARKRTGWKGVVANGLVSILGPSKASAIVSKLAGERIALRKENLSRVGAEGTL
ncbi:MAG TPA: class I SAM-dependent methyltransferase [Phycisphaerae bacterium]|nr:class I SAM-dependent methyltransferase [Phycisphaerae bacterium]